MPFPVAIADGAAPRDAVTDWSWSARPTATGDAVFRVTFHAGDGNECEASAEATGSASWGPQVLFRFNQTSVTYARSPIVHVHDDELSVDTRGSSASRYEMGATISGSRSGVHQVTLALRGMEADESGASPATIGVACDRPFTVLGFSGSREVAAWRHDSMGGGRGASASPVVADAGVNMNDVAVAHLVSPLVEVDLRESSVNTAGRSEWRLDAPSGTYGDEGPIEYDRFRLEDGPGDYRFQLTRIAAGEFSRLTLWVLGFDEVPSLDEIPA